MTAAASRSVRFGALDPGVVLAMNVLWGLNIAAVKKAVTQAAPLTAALLRQAIVFAACATWLRIVPGGTLMLALPGARAIAGQPGVPSSLILVFEETIHAPRIVGIALAFVGVAPLETLVMAPLAWAFEPDAVRGIPALRMSTMSRVVFCATGSTVPGQGAMSWSIRRHPISTVTPLTLAAPVVSVFTAAWWFATPPRWPMLAGGAVVMPGVAIVSVRTAQARDRTANVKESADA